ncbi:MAG: redoxin family protein [Fimbriiglobus sp.]
MKVYLLSLLLMLGSLATAAEGPKPIAPQQAGVGRRVPSFSAKDIVDKTHTLEALFKDHKAVVLAFTSATCPISQKYLPTLAKLEKEFTAKGVRFVYINPISTDPAKAIRDQIEAHGLRGVYIHDAEEALAKLLNANSTGDVFVLDAKQTVIYRGAVDDQYGLGYQLDQAKRSYLHDALSAHLARQAIRVSATTAPGCELALEKGKTSESKFTYHEHISRLMQQSCVECHRAGGVGPFTLTSYADVVARKGMIRKVVDNGTMPPWFTKATPGHFSNDRSLTDSDKTMLLTWLKASAPEGDASLAPLPRNFPKDWAIGTPDSVVSLPKPIKIAATGTMPYQNVVVEVKNSEEHWVSALEIRPTNAAVVHHVLVFVASEGEAALPNATPRGVLGRLREQADERKGSFAAYVPGNSYQIFPQGFAKKLPKNAKLRFQIHYTPNGQATEDQLKLGLKYAKSTPDHELKVTALFNPRISIPPGAERHEETAMLKVPQDAMLTAFTPHMHVRGAACKYELTTPQGEKTVLLDIPHYDFNWQLKYELASPIKVPQGSTLRFTAWYDNSDKNPANPDPKVTVKWGPQTTEEMMLGYLEYYLISAKK